MLKNSTVCSILNDPGVELKQLNSTNKSSENTIKAIKAAISCLDEGLRKYLKDNQLKFKVLNKEDINSKDILEQFEDIKCFSYTDLNIFTVFLIQPTIISKVDAANHIIHNILHEIGHIILNKLLTDTLLPELRTALIRFGEESEKEGGVSWYSDKYIKGIYGKKVKDVNGYVLKYHENFAEFYRLQTEYNTDSKYNKNVDIKTYIPDKFTDSYTAFKGILKHAE